MIRLHDFLTRDTLHPMEAASHDVLLHSLLERCFRPTDGSIDPGRIDALVRTHAMKEQFLGNGFALSHTRADTLPEIRLSIGLLGAPKRFLRRDLVHTVFCVLIPADRSREYLSFLAALGRLLQTPGAADVFQSADVNRILAFLAEHNE